MADFLFGKRGAAGVTLTWIVATGIIVLLMVIFLVLSGVIFKEGKARTFFTGTATYVSLAFPEQQQSVFALASTPGVAAALITAVPAIQSGAAPAAVVSVLKPHLEDFQDLRFVGGGLANAWRASVSSPGQSGSFSVEGSSIVGRVFDTQSFAVSLPGRPDIVLRLDLRCKIFGGITPGSPAPPQVIRTHCGDGRKGI
jgi:hypothetical protein